MKKLLSMVLILCMVLVVFVGCGDKTDTPDQSVGSDSEQPANGSSGEVETVEYFSSVGAYKTLLEERVDEFNNTVGKEKGIFINLTSEIDNASTVLETAIKSGNSPDLYSAQAETMPNYSTSGWIKPLTDVPEIADLVAEWDDYDLPMVTSYKGEIYSLVLETLPIKLAYNKDLFKAAGIVDANGEADPPETWDEVLDAAKKITEAGKGEYYGLGFSFQWTSGIRRTIFKPYMASTKVGWFDNVNGEYNFENMRPALEFIQQMAEDKSYFPGIESIAIDPIRAQFSDGKVGMEFAPAYDIAVYNDQFPHVGDWGISEVPTIDPDTAGKGVAIIRGNLFWSSTVEEDRNWAVAEVFNWLHADEFYQHLYEECAIIPLKSELIEQAENVKEKTGWREMSSNLENYVGMPPFPDKLVNITGNDYHTVFSDMFFGNISIDEAIETCNERYKKALETAVSDGKVVLEDYKIPEDHFNK